MLKFKYIFFTFIAVLLLAASVFAYSFFNPAPIINIKTLNIPAINNPVKPSPSGITGVAMLGPMCPVQKNPPDPNCADRPYKTNLVVTSSDGTKIIAQFSSDTNGKFNINLPAGQYQIASSDTASFFSHCSSQGVITVESGKYTNITLKCDTGIR